MRVLYIPLKSTAFNLIKNGEMCKIPLAVNNKWTNKLIENGKFVPYGIVVIFKCGNQAERIAFRVDSISIEKMAIEYQNREVDDCYIITFGDKYTDKIAGYEKICTTCGRLLPASKFFYNAKTYDNRSPACKDCYSKLVNKGADECVKSLKNEEWRDVIGYEGLYQVSNLGRVKSLSRTSVCSNGTTQRVYEKLRLLRIDTQTGYYRVALSKDGISKMYGVHRLVAMAFIPNPNKYLVVNHIDWDRTNNVTSNLEWCTQKQNVERMNWDKWNQSNNVRPIQQMSLNGEVIAVYKNMKEAAKATGIPHSTISAACRGKYENKQFIWKRL